ncbi:DUF982 domain-containing protein [Phyllobacterium meliloti]|uniref:DUF982 domain-containing protein n=1 Tax=Phyllobacterium meliloti TaxID=555317 RepID=UPI001F4366FD|nr:DUF982 domain-containing protein [Phyllobacterium sp. T1293]UGX87144.1 DUF982 domain-containing protein [Phyllobacterium sp. T1293]
MTIETKKVGLYRNITSVEEAAEFLVYDWPIEKGPLQLQARIDCLDAMENALDAEQARASFIAAVKEAGIFVREGR